MKKIYAMNKEEKQKRLRAKQRFYVIGVFLCVELVNFAAAVTGGSFFYYNLCGTIAGKISLPTWLMIFGIVNTFCNVVFALLVHFYYHNNCASKNAAGTIPVGDMIYPLCIGIPVGIILVIGLFFQISWFLVGAVCLSSVTDTCIEEATLVYAFSIVEMIVTPLALCYLKPTIWKTFK